MSGDSAGHCLVLHQKRYRKVSFWLQQKQMSCGIFIHDNEKFAKRAFHRS